MTETRRCPQCGTELPPDAPGGICPNCVLQMGFGSAPPIENPVSPDAASSGGARAAIVPPPVPPGLSQPDTFLGGGFIPPAADELAKVFPQLEILELLGKGGMGAVYKARQPTLDRMVAVKILPPAVAADPTFAERFMREARALARLSHPHIVSVYDFGQVQGQYYFVMEYVDGANLRTAIQNARLNASQALAIVPQICEALQYAHDEGVVHRDIKPENILIDKRGRVKIADFGLAKIVGQGSNLGGPGAPPNRDFTLTGTHQVMGTMHYMAPEQIEKPQTVDHRADIYSLGVVFYEMLTGELPIGRFAPPSQKVEMDVRLDEVVLRSLEKEPDRRYQHASDVKFEVESIGRNPTPLPVPAGGTVSAATRPEPAVDLESARQQVRGPAIGLMCAGGLNILTLLVLLLGATAWFLTPMTLMPGLDAERQFCRHDGAPVAIAASGLVPVASIVHRVPQIVAAAEGPSDSRSVRLMVLLTGPLACAVVVGFLTLFGALQMLRLNYYPLAIFTAIVAMLPCTPGSLIGVPCGIWALVVLSRSDVRAAFHENRQPGGAGKNPTGPAATAGFVQPTPASTVGFTIGPLPASFAAVAAGELVGSPAIAPPTVNLESARRQVRGPAIGLFWTGLLTVTLGIGLVLWSGWTLQRIGWGASQTKAKTSQGQTNVTVTPQFDRYPPAPLLWLILIGQAAATAIGGMLMFAADSMARLQEYELVRRWSVLAKIPATPVWLLGLPIVLRCQAVLSRPEIRNAFDMPDVPAARGTADESQRRGGLFPAPWNRLSLAAGIVALTGALATFLPWLRLDVAGMAILLPGYDGGYGIATGVIFLSAGLIRILAGLRQVERIWGTVASAAAAVVVLALTGLFLYDVAHPRFTSSASGDLAGNSALAESLEAMLMKMLQQSFNYTLHIGAFVALGCSVVLLGLASVEFFRRSPETVRDAGL